MQPLYEIILMNILMLLLVKASQEPSKRSAILIGWRPGQTSTSDHRALNGGAPVAQLVDTLKVLRGCQILRRNPFQSQSKTGATDPLQKPFAFLFVRSRLPT